MTKILIADDEKNIRAGIAKILSEELSGSAVFLEAKNGEDALEIALREKPDILITDIRMPKMDGMELMRRVREAGADIRIIVLSGYDDFSYAQKAIHYQASSYILKPADRQELCLAIQNLIADLPKKETVPALPQLIKRSSFIEEAIAWIDRHYTEDINMSQAANQVSVNYTYFSEKFKEHTGSHFNEYLMRLRVARAMRLLIKGSYHVYEVAQKCGYHDVKYFLRHFKKITGMSPGEFSRIHGAYPGIDSEDEPERIVRIVGT